MADEQYMQFLQTCLPRFGLRWQGFRKVRKQVIKRIKRRLKELHLGSLSAYQAYLEHHPEEWMTVDGFCRITISRFYRDRDVFDTLHMAVLPRLAQMALERNQQELRCWSAGCASGEEAYTLSMVWYLSLAAKFPPLQLRIVATDADKDMLVRASKGRYGLNSLRELPAGWIASGFQRHDDGYRVRKAYRDAVCFVAQDMRKQFPDGPFHLVMCRNLAFTYFAEPVQRKILARIAEQLVTGGILVVGKHESLPRDGTWFVAYDGQQSIFQKHTPA